MQKVTESLVVILGPTAVGKTDLSLRLAQDLQAEIISADSRLFYRGMNLGTAKPSPDELASVPHHLIDVAEPDQVYSVALYLEKALEAIQEIHARNHLPLVVGGTGQYIRALVEGWDLPIAKPDPRLREALERWADVTGIGGLRSRLAVLDPEAERAIDGPNLRRIVRALEVILKTGQKFSEQSTKSGSKYRILQIGLIRPRDELYQRIDQRVELMLEAGLVEEVRSLIKAGYSPDSSAMSAIGYLQIAAHLSGEISLAEAVRQIKSKTRKFVRQQSNWFRENDPDIHWFEPRGDYYQQILNQIQHFLS